MIILFVSSENRFDLGESRAKRLRTSSFWNKSNRNSNATSTARYVQSTDPAFRK